MNINRRSFLLSGTAAGASIAFPGIAFGQAQYKLKFANIMPVDHPLNVRMREASATSRTPTTCGTDRTSH